MLTRLITVSNRIKPAHSSAVSSPAIHFHAVSSSYITGHLKVGNTSRIFPEYTCFNLKTVIVCSPNYAHSLMNEHRVKCICRVRIASETHTCPSTAFLRRIFVELSPRSVSRISIIFFNSRDNQKLPLLKRRWNLDLKYIEALKPLSRC